MSELDRYRRARVLYLLVLVFLDQLSWDDAQRLISHINAELQPVLEDV